MKTERPPRILFFAKDHENPYGATWSFLSIAQHFHRQGSQLAFYFIHPGCLAQMVSEWQVPCDGYRFDWQSRKTAVGRIAGLVLQKLAVLWAVFRLFLRGRYELLYINTATHVTPLMVAWLLRKPAILHVREGVEYFEVTRGRTRRMINRVRNAVMRRCATRIVCVSQNVADNVNRLLRTDRAVAVHNGVCVRRLQADSPTRETARRTLGLADSDFVIMSAGRMHEEKAAGLFLEAGIAACDTIPDLRLIALGGPPDTDYLLNVVQPLADSAPSGLVLLPGYQQNMADYYAAADVFVHPATYDEPLARTILEAMAVGKCVVATRVGGTPEIIEDGVSGILVEPASVGSLSEAFVELYRNPERRASLQERAKQRITEAFTEERYLTDLSRHVTEVLSGSSGG